MWRSKDEQVPLAKGLLLLLRCSPVEWSNTHKTSYDQNETKKKPVQEDKNKYCHNWNIQPYPCRWQLSFPEARLNFLPLRDLEHIWSSDSSVWIRCACSGPLTDTLWTAHAPVSWWGFPRWTTSAAVNGCRGTGGAGGAREECRFKTSSKYPRRPAWADCGVIKLPFPVSAV